MPNVWTPVKKTAPRIRNRGIQVNFPETKIKFAWFDLIYLASIFFSNFTRETVVFIRLRSRKTVAWWSIFAVPRHFFGNYISKPLPYFRHNSHPKNHWIIAIKRSAFFQYLNALWSPSLIGLSIVRLHHCLSVNGSSFRKLIIENMSFTEFWIGVPVIIHRRSLFRARTAFDIRALGFLITCPSSRTTLSHSVSISADVFCEMKWKYVSFFKQGRVGSQLQM